MPTKKNSKEVWSKTDRRGPADKASYVGSDLAVKNLRDKFLGLLPKARNLGGVPAGPISASRAKLGRPPVAEPKDKGEGGGPGGGPCPVNVTRQNSSGPLITNPKVVLMWWSTYFWDVHKTEKNYYKAALNAFGNDAAFWKRLSEYGITGGSYAGTIDLTRFGGPSTSVSEAAIQSALTFRFDNLSTPPDQSSIYVVMLPNGVTSAYDTSSGFIGHHQTYKYKGKSIWYAVVEYSSNTSRTLNVITHEVYEAATDPDLSTGYWDPAHGGETEVGDLCNLQTMMMDGYPVQQVWSQKACACK